MKRNTPSLLSILVVIIPLMKTDPAASQDLLGINCNEDSNCTPQNSYCNDTSYRCRCTDDYYPNNDKTTCVQYAKNVKDPCEREIGCKLLKNSECKEHLCECREDFEVLNNLCKPRSHGSCSATGSCAGILSRGICSNGKCTCTENLNYFGATGSYCSSYPEELDIFSSLSEGCQNFPNSYFSNSNNKKTCACKEGYTKENNNKCLADINMDCPDDSYCRVGNSFCNDWQQCECEHAYFPSADKKSCVKYEIDGICDSNNSCGHLQNSKCESKTCKCLPGTEKGEEGECWFPDWLSCKSLEACPPDSFCSSPGSSCHCNSGFVQGNESCYGTPGTGCSSASHCLSSAYTCLSTSCALIEHRKEKYSDCSSKNGTTTCWMEVSNGLFTALGVGIGDSEERICLVDRKDGTSVLGTVSGSEPNCTVQLSTKESYSSYQLLVNTRNLEWNENLILDSAVLGGTEGNNLFLICRTKIGTYVLGRLEPPRYRRCHIFREKEHFQRNFQVLTANGAACSSENFTFVGGICKCSSGFYSHFDNCYKIPSRPNVQVDSFEACSYLKNTSYSGGKCRCKIGYYLVDDHCFKIPTGLEVPCDNCPTDSTCSGNFCHCDPGFVKMGGSCYGLPGAECSKESKCISKFHVCQSGVCQEIGERKEENGSCTGSVCWSSYDGTNSTTSGVVGGTDQNGSQYVCRSVRGTSTIPGELRAHIWLRCVIAAGTESISSQQFDILVNNQHLTWTKSYQLDQAVPGGTTEDNKPYLICRFEHRGLFYIGNLEPPLYELCSAGGESVRVSSDFETLVDSSGVPGTCQSDCSLVDSVCSNGVCQCKPGFFKHNESCYGFPQAECSESSKCLSTAYSCQSNTCRKIAETTSKGLQCTSKSSKSVCWKVFEGDQPDDAVTTQDGGSNENVCRLNYPDLVLPGRHPFSDEYTECVVLLDDNVETFDSFDVLVGKNFQWTNSYSLDKAVSAGESGGKPFLFCRTEVDGSATIGNLVPPLYDLCHTSFVWELGISGDFEVLVEKEG